MRDRDLQLRIGSTSPGHPPAYYFSMFLDGVRGKVGGIDLRLDEANIVGGQIGYVVAPRFRGQGLASRALRLLLPLVQRHGFERLWVTCDPDNLASRRTCEKAGFRLHEILTIPQKCRYVLEIAGKDPTPGHS
ncbi:MAG: GNAT family N-acetyltransferase [Candidatus Eremiobacteraeota bacterium]|nr:GNAT family N-acetyltransferase [Candidatus Eremiobacteraeota bacterium]